MPGIDHTTRAANRGANQPSPALDTVARPPVRRRRQGALMYWLRSTSLRGMGLAAVLCAALLATLVPHPGTPVEEASAQNVTLTLSILSMVQVGNDTYAGTSDGVYRSTSVAVNPPNSWTLFRGGVSGLPVGRVTGLAYDPEDNKLYAAVEAVGVYVATPPTLSWKAYNTGLTVSAAERITTLRSFGTSHLYAGFSSGKVYQTLFGTGVTASWSQVGTTTPTGSIRRLLRVGEQLLAATASGVYWADPTDATPTWALDGTAGQLGSVNDLVYTGDNVSNESVFAATGNGVWRRDPNTTGGWTAWNTGITGATLNATALSIFGGGASIMGAYTVGARSGIFVSAVPTSSGAWSAAAPLSATNGTSLPVNHMIAYNSSNAVFGTTQGPYVLLPDSPNNFIRAAGNLQATSGPTATRTVAPTRTATVVPTATVPKNVAVPTPGALAQVAVRQVLGVGKDRFFTSSDAVFRSTDVVSGPPGKWEMSLVGLNTRQAANLVGLAYDDQRNITYAASGTAGGAVYRSVATNPAWQSTGGPNLDATSVPRESLSALHSYGTSILYAGTTNGRVFYFFMNNDESWDELYSNSPGLGAIRSLFRAGEILYAGTDTGIWAADVSQSPANWVQEVRGTGRVVSFAEVDGHVFAATPALGIMHRDGLTPGVSWIPENSRGGVTLPSTAGYAVSTYISDGFGWLMAAVGDGRGRVKLYRTGFPGGPVTTAEPYGTWTEAVKLTLPPVTGLVASGHLSAVIGSLSGPYVLNGEQLIEVSQVKQVAVPLPSATPTASPVPSVTPTKAPTNTPGPTNTPAPAAARPGLAAPAPAQSATGAAAASTGLPGAAAAAPVAGAAGGAAAAAPAAAPPALPASVLALARTRVGTGGGLALSGEAGLSVVVASNSYPGDVDVTLTSLQRPDPRGSVRLGSTLNYALQRIPMVDVSSQNDVPPLTSTDDARIWVVASTPFDVRVSDAATGRDVSMFPVPIDLGLNYSLDDFPRGSSEFDLALGRWDEIAQHWVRLPVRQDGLTRNVHTFLDAPGVVALMTLAPLSFYTMEDTHFFPATGQSISPATFDFINANGGAVRTGMPLADPQSIAGVTQRIFQRARIDRSDGTGEQFFGAIGVEYLQRTGQTFPASPDSGSSAEQRYFPETGQYVSFGFLTYYDVINGPQSLGLPISPQLQDPVTGRPFQYFTRGKLEWNLTTNQVEVANLGSELLNLTQAQQLQGIYFPGLDPVPTPAAG